MNMNSKILTFSLADHFIERLVDYIETEYIRQNKKLDRLAIVFGGKRPALFLKKELAKRLQTSFYPPQFFTIDEFMRYVVTKKEVFQSIQDLDHCYLLYQLAKKIAPEILHGRESFAKFLPWTREILAFIEQLDLENVDDNALKNVQANAEIGYPVPQDINRLLQSIVLLRTKYHAHCEEQKVYPRGFQYLRASQTIDDVQFEEFDQILFCNFFYWHACEETVTKNLFKRDQATLIFQGDQKAWPILKKIAKEWQTPIEPSSVSEPRFQLKVYAGFDLHSEVSVVREILKSIAQDDPKALEKTVVVLPDSQAIIPLLSQMTNVVKDFNISLGYPLKRSSLYSLFEFVFAAQLSIKDRRYYAKDYLKVLRHPFVKNLTLGLDHSVTRVLIHKIEEILTGKEKTEISGSLFFSLKDMENLKALYELTLETSTEKNSKEKLRDILQEIHRLFFLNWENIQNFENFAKSLEIFLDALLKKSSMDHYPLNVNIATKMLVVKDELEEAAFKKETFLKEEMFKIFENKIGGEMVTFTGSPLKGLQVLGLLETRSLNFENVIILDVNEGTLPKLNLYEPLIPRDVMISLNLDRLELEEEIQRYQFRRLISSAKNVHLVYQESREKEKSRFVEELVWERQKVHAQKNVNLVLEDIVPVIHPSFEVKMIPKEKVVKKTPQMIEFLKNHTYSASSINMYLRDPIEFYENYVLGLKPEDDLLDEPEARHVGTFIHKVFEESFQSFLGKKPVIDERFRERVKKISEQRFQEMLGKSMKSDSFLLKAVIEERIRRFLDNEATIEREVEEILFLEKRFSDTISLSCGNIKFAYVVDRVDRLKDGTIMIIDYKTGYVDQMPKAIDRIETMELTRENVRDYVRSFQIPLYFNYLNKQFPQNSINAALYSLRTMELDKFLDSKTNYDRERIDETFLRALDFVLSEILDLNVDFVADQALISSSL